MPTPSRDGVACAGNWTVEHVYSASTFPGEGQLARVKEARQRFGGCAYNVIRNLHDLAPDMFLYAIGLVGDDEAGRDLLTDLHHRDIDTFQLVALPEVPTAHAEVFVSQSSGRQTSFYDAGANGMLSPAQFDFSHCLATWLHLGSLMLLDQLDAPDAEFGSAAARVLHMAKAEGLTTSIDLIADDRTTFAAIVEAALPHADYLIITAEEAARCCGEKVSPMPKSGRAVAEKWATTLLNKGVQQAVVIHFAEGTLAVAKDGNCQFTPSLTLPEQHMQNQSATGGAFSAGFIYATLAGWELEKRLLLGQSCAAQKVMDAEKRLLKAEKCLEWTQKYSNQES